MELSHQPPSSHPLTAPVHPPERVTGPPELHHSKGRYRKQYGDMQAVPLNESDFAYGGINRDSFIRAFKLFTGNESLILGVAGHLTHSKLSEVIGQLVEMLSACLRDDTF
jgi:mRNA interferase MazF